MRHTEFWRRMEAALSPSYARSFAADHVFSSLGGRTVMEALEVYDAKVVWRAVHAHLSLPASLR